MGTRIDHVMVCVPDLDLDRAEHLDRRLEPLARAAPEAGAHLRPGRIDEGGAVDARAAAVIYLRVSLVPIVTSWRI